MWSVISSALAVIFLIIFIIGVHELGHYCAARWFGVHVVRFSIGFGKPWLRWRDRSGTEYCVGLLPIGGYVKLLDERIEPVADQMRAYSMQSHTTWQKIGIMVAGPVSNLLCAFIIFWLVFVIGIYQVEPVIAKIIDHTPAAHAQLSAGEKIVQADQYPITNWREMTFVLMTHLGRNDTLTLVTIPLENSSPSSRQTYIIELTDWQVNPLHPELLESVGLVPLTPQNDPQIVHHVRYSAWQAVLASCTEIFFYLKFNIIVMAKLLIGQISLQSIAGPLTMFYQASVFFKLGSMAYFYFIAMLSAIIALINLLPIPGLDGAHILYLLFEKIKGRPVSMATQALIYRLGMIVIIVLCVQILIYDGLRLILAE